MTLQAVKPAFLAIIVTVAAAVAPIRACAQNAAGAQKQHQAPAPTPPKPAATSDDRPYDAQLFRLAEILGTLHYLRELCGANEGQAWREHMRELTASEGTSALRRAKLVRVRHQGRSTLYSIDPKGLKPLVNWIARYKAFWTERVEKLQTLLEEMD